MRLKWSRILCLCFMVILFLSSAAKLVYGDWVTGTRKVYVSITGLGGAMLSGDGASLTWRVDVSSLKDARQIAIHVYGYATDDPYVRFLLVYIDGQLVNPTEKPTTPPPSSGGSGGGGSIGGEQPYFYYKTVTTTVWKEFEVQYDVTSLVKGKDYVTVKIELLTSTGYWHVMARFIGIVEEKIYIPPKPEQPSTGESQPVSEKPTSSESSGGEEEPTISPSLPPEESQQPTTGEETTSSEPQIEVVQPRIAISLADLSAILGVICVAGGFYLRRELE